MSITMSKFTFTTLKTILIALVFTISSNESFAQTSNGIFFQAVARDNFSNPAKDRKIYVQSSIIQTTPTGNKVLTEEHQANTDAMGVFSISLGNGVRVGGTANSLTTIDWSKGPFYLNLKVAITPIGASTGWDYTKEWVDMGTTSFGAVPFALYSASSAKVDDKLNVSDTTTMLKVYAKAMSVKTLETAVASKLTAADTLTMLKPYAKAAYTIDSNFFRTQLATKLSLSDSTIYVTPTQLAAKTFDQTPINSAIASKLNIADSTNTYITPTQFANITAKKLTTARNINGVLFDGSADIILPTPLVDAGDLIGTTINASVTGSNLTSVGTITSGIWNGTTISVANGGTGQSSIAGIKSAIGLVGTNVSIGENAANINQGNGSVAIGASAGQEFQGNQSIAIGYVAGSLNQGTNSVAIGSNAAQTGQGSESVSIGFASNSLGANATSIGSNSSASASNAIAIGTFANNSVANTIQLGADGTLPSGNPIPAIVDVRTSGTLTAGTVTYPNTHGSANQILTTTGSGTLIWSNPSNSLSGVDLISAQTVAGSKSFIGNIRVGTSTPTLSAVLEVSSATQGFLPPRMNRDQRNSISSPVIGLMIFCTNCSPKGDPEFYDGTRWTSMNATQLPNVSIGDQIWSSVNLNVSRYSNGDIIPYVKKSDWIGLTSGAWAWYDDDSIKYAATVGKLYNWYAVNDSRGLAPLGWHIPSNSEWANLINYLGGYNLAANAIQESGNSHWASPSNNNANNHTNFNGYPGGYMYSRGTGQISTSAYWWTSTTNNVDPYAYYIDNNSKLLFSTFPRDFGFSVRCVRD